MARAMDILEANGLPDDFRVRHRLPTALQLFIVAASAFLTLLAAHLYSGSDLAFVLIAAAVTLLANGLMILSMQRARDQVMATEFQNTLFSSVMRTGTLFCLIARKDGGVVYTDDGLRRLLPPMGGETESHLDGIFRLAGLGVDDTGALYAAIGGGQSAARVVTLKDREGLSHKMMLMVDPIRRPRDFVVLRGRAYVERSA